MDFLAVEVFVECPQGLTVVFRLVMLRGVAWISVLGVVLSGSTHGLNYGLSQANCGPAAVSF